LIVLTNLLETGSCLMPTLADMRLRRSGCAKAPHSVGLDGESPSFKDRDRTQVIHRS